MKQTYQFTDNLTKITHTIYELENGIKVLHALNPSSIDYVLTIIVKAGSSYETQLEIPHGTSHFLEHIISGNPNKIFKSKFEIDEFESGNKDEPEIFSNASTSQKYIYFYAYGNEDGSSRINQRIKSVLDYPLENIAKYIEKERKIILAELSQDNKEEYNRHIQFTKFLYEGKDAGFTHSVIGDKENIERITVKDIKKLLKERFCSNNTVITIQTGAELLPSQIDEIKEIGNILPKSQNEYPDPGEYVESKTRYHHFKDEHIQGSSIALLFLDEIKEKIDYKQEVLEFLFRRLLNKVSHDILREEKGLIYSSHISSSGGSSFKQRVIGYELVMQDDNYEKLLNSLNNLIEKDIYKFLHSKEGNIWFENVISGYIFPRTIPYKTNYAEEKGLPLIEGAEVFELEKAVNETIKLNIKDVEKFSKDFFTRKCLFWLESCDSGKKMISKLIKSKLYKRFE